MIILQTNHGPISIELDANTPLTSENFLQHAKNGFYEGVLFHRVINGFMIQGGGFNQDMKQKSAQPTIRNEADKGQPNKRGTVAMARTSDPHSASTQFFINVADNAFLNFKSEKDWGYCVFGKVISGMEVVDEIKKVPTTTRLGHENVPVEPVIIEKVVVTAEE
ncbi:MAG: ppiB [Gammaproteobacteria bacterium]|nr:ppiB [Gammaproteobacteria bacterium]